MRVYGEAFFLMNGWMDYLCLMLTASLGRRRFRPGRALLAAGLGAGYALIAWMGGAWLRCVPALAAAALGMTSIAFGRGGLRLWPLTGAAGLFLSGTADCLIQARIGPLPGMLMCGGSALGIAFLLRSGTARGQGEFRLQVILADRSVWLPALRDSGNLLRDGPGGLPVIVAPAALLGPLLPSGLRCADLSTLPPGWRLALIHTAAGSRCLMCFRPDGLILARGKCTWPVRAAVAVSDFASSRAMLPDAIFAQEGKEHASL